MAGKGRGEGGNNVSIGKEAGAENAHPEKVGAKNEAPPFSEDYHFLKNEMTVWHYCNGDV